MAVTCNDFLSLKSTHGAVLRAGKSGLGHTIVWFHSLESISDVPFLQPDELVFFTGISIGEDEEQIIRLVHEVAERRAAGMVINTGKYIKTISDRVAEAADRAGLPLFDLPWSVKLGRVTQELGQWIVEERVEEKNISGLIKKVLFSEENTNLILDANLLYNRGLPKEKRILSVVIPKLSQAQSEYVSEIQAIGNAVERILRSVGFSTLYLWNGNEMILILAKETNAAELVGAIRKRLEADFKLKAFFGLGRTYTHIGDLRKSHREACFACQMAEVDMLAGENRFVEYSKIGVFRLFAEIKDASGLRQYEEEVLGPIRDYDRKNKSGFLDTLQIYLEENEDIVATCKRLFIHRNTLSYRLKRIEEITQRSMTDAEARLDFRIAFKICVYLQLIDSED